MKEEKKLPMYGVGPLYVAVVMAITAALIILHCCGVLASGAIGALGLRILFYILGGLLIAFGIVLWVLAVLVDKIDRDIESNKLKTTGIYAAVRNPIYAAFLYACTGALLCCANWWMLAAPVVFYLYLTVLMIFTEEKWLKAMFGQEYIAYCKTVNRCIPRFVKRGEHQ